ncbi:MAG: metallophosphoesterase [Cyanosarcina radialis HA8281-LM2]|nr:metallophosphoesterase [Cyanosarcina radialis HA8281-LM2]
MKRSHRLMAIAGLAVLAGSVPLYLQYAKSLSPSSSVSPGSNEPAAAAKSDPVFVGAGDIANCFTDTDEATAKLLDGIPGKVFTLGDNVYNDGAAEEFKQCYQLNWGRHKQRTFPSPGNHDYHSRGAAPYYAYFGANTGPAGRGYYSYNLGQWHIISLNSNVDAAKGSEQEKWLRADLAANPKACTLAYWHHPVFSSGQHGNDPIMQDIWQTLYEYEVDVVLNGHDHNYERFALQNPDGQADPERGIRQFVVGTGGTSLRSEAAVRPNSEVRNFEAHGVLKLTLRSTSYDWEFVPIAGATFKDKGSADCVASTRLPPTPSPTTTPTSK